MNSDEGTKKETGVGVGFRIVQWLLACVCHIFHSPALVTGYIRFEAGAGSRLRLNEIRNELGGVCFMLWEASSSILAAIFARSAHRSVPATLSN